MKRFSEKKTKVFGYPYIYYYKNSNQGKDKLSQGESSQDIEKTFLT